MFVEHGAGLTLTCAVSGSPVPNVTWYRNGNQINNGSSNALIHETLLELNVSFTLSILELCPVTLEDAGEYSCHAMNTIGNHTVLFQVIVNYGKTEQLATICSITKYYFKQRMLP